MDRRHHIGGNAYSEPEPETGIEIHRYGAHLFHTSNERVWEYVNRFTAFTGYQHRVFSIYKGRVYPLPINLGTISEFFGAAMSPDEARALIAEQAAEVKAGQAANLEREGSVADRAAPVRGVHPRLHGQAVADRPGRPARRRSSPGCRCGTRSTTATSATPSRACRPTATPPGWSGWPTTRTSRCGWAPTSAGLRADAAGSVPVVYTGALDAYFDYAAGDLGWRTLDFELEVLPTGDFQGTPVMNYADDRRAVHPHPRVPALPSRA